MRAGIVGIERNIAERKRDRLISNCLRSSDLRTILFFHALKINKSEGSPRVLGGAPKNRTR